MLYKYTEKGMFWNRPGRNDEINPMLLSNFAAEIVSQVTSTDGEREEIQFEIEVLVKGRKEHIILSASEFESPDWPTKKIGAEAIRYPGHGFNDHLRVAIQACSTNIREKRVFLHTGWTQIEGKQFFIHAGGFLGPDGPMGSIFELNNKKFETQIHPALASFQLPDPPDGDELRSAIKHSLNITMLAPPNIALPFLASVYRPLLGPCDYSIFLSGASGGFKSSIAAIGQQHYGSEMNAEHLPANWDSTSNANLAIAHLAKDVLLVVDDWVLRGSKGEMDRMQRDADRLLRSQANHAGRARATPQGQPRFGGAPRCVLLGTGEATPDGHSLNSRMLLLDIQRGDINKRLLSLIQSAAREGLLAQSLSALVHWLAPDRETKLQEMNSRRNEFRDNIQADSDHPRTATMVADVLAGFEVFLDFAQEKQAIDPEEYDRLFCQMNDVLYHYIDFTNQSLKLASPIDRFMGLLRTAFLTGKAHLQDATGDVPGEDAESWGWKVSERWVTQKTGETESDVEGKWVKSKKPRGVSIGYVVGCFFYLDISATLSVLQPIAREAGQSLPYTDRTLGRALCDAGLLERSDRNRGRYTSRVIFEGRRSNYLVMRTAVLWEPEYPIDQDAFEDLLA